MPPRGPIPPQAASAPAMVGEELGNVPEPRDSDVAGLFRLRESSHSQPLKVAAGNERDNAVQLSNPEESVRCQYYRFPESQGTRSSQGRVEACHKECGAQ